MLNAGHAAMLAGGGMHTRAATMMLRRNTATAATSADSSSMAAAASDRSRSRPETAPTTTETKATTARGRIPAGILLLLLFLLTTAVTMAGSALSNEPNPSLRAGTIPPVPSHTSSSVGPIRNAARIVTQLRSVVYSTWTRLWAGLGLGGGRKKKRPASAPVVDPSMEITILLQANLCPNTVRAGDEGDGGWWLCGADSAVGNDCVVYSFGIRENFSFDHYVAGRGCTVHGFDPSPAGLHSEASYESITPTGTGHGKGQAIYHPYGLGNDGTYEPGTVPFRWPGMGYLRDSNSNQWTLKTLPRIQTELENDRITVLKVDIEGGEWDMMTDIIQSDWDELCMELHFYPGYFYVFETDTGGLNIIEEHHATHQIQRPEQSVGSVSRIQLLKKLNEVADMFLWEPNGDDCVEVYFRRKR
mmetsp:Transcript_22208/g.48363  ORF Transcript_22208/g.48363 Transcript_22208/m.48363 type:complete len:416 (+) Transcript_22208:68-1315(+)